MHHADAIPHQLDLAVWFDTRFCSADADMNRRWIKKRLSGQLELAWTASLRDTIEDRTVGAGRRLRVAVDVVPVLRGRQLLAGYAVRLGLSEEVANAIVFIASDEASFITGHVLNVDGGKSH
jgi:NAD(P)-dependent dehydrogenase (short-subunit alcohol dehydrogenase family)